MKPAGYLLNTANGIEGERGLFYDYILAGNGTFVAAENNLIAARVCVAEAEIRGLQPLKEEVTLKHGKLPEDMLTQLMVKAFGSKNEVYAAVAWDEAAGQYRLEKPEQTGTAGSVKYSFPENTVLDFHSHPNMRAFFSGTDNRDDQGLRFNMVLGSRGKNVIGIQMCFRLGAYGYFMPVTAGEVFCGELAAAMVPSPEADTPDLIVRRWEMEGDDELPAETE